MVRRSVAWADKGEKLSRVILGPFLDPIETFGSIHNGRLSWSVLRESHEKSFSPKTDGFCLCLEPWKELKSSFALAFRICSFSLSLPSCDLASEPSYSSSLSRLMGVEGAGVERFEDLALPSSRAFRLSDMLGGGDRTKNARGQERVSNREEWWKSLS